MNAHEINGVEIVNNEVWITKGPLLNFKTSWFDLPHPVARFLTPGGETLNRYRYKSVEHRFQAMKCLYLTEDLDWSETHNWIAEAPGAGMAKERGRQIRIDSELWDRSSYGHMLEAHLAKFSVNSGLGAMLFSTGDMRLVEHRPDPLWGDNKDGTGKNLCGSSLMVTRYILRNYFPELAKEALV